jgi:hypothetical protein
MPSTPWRSLSDTLPRLERSGDHVELRTAQYGSLADGVRSQCQSPMSRSVGTRSVESTCTSGTAGRRATFVTEMAKSTMFCILQRACRSRGTRAEFRCSAESARVPLQIGPAAATTGLGFRIDYCTASLLARLTLMPRGVRAAQVRKSHRLGGIIEANEQVAFPPLRCGRCPALGCHMLMAQNGKFCAAAAAHCMRSAFTPRRRLVSDQAFLQGQPGQLGSPPQPALVADAVQVRPDGADTDV